MKDTEFNLIDERWIRVIDKKCDIAELSLNELFRDAHLYADLCGELPTQDIAVMRILLAILHTVIARYTPEGDRVDTETADDAIDRWKDIWDNGSFPSGVIDKYLDAVKDRFWLFHPVYPFMQEPLAKYGTKYTASKLNGELSESNNKDRLFRMFSGKDKDILTMPQAARWLLYVNAFDDTSAKPSSLSRSRKIKYDSPGAGWLGKLGLITLRGRNLFETLMLNLVIPADREDAEVNRQTPSWERERYIPDDAEDVCIERVERVRIVQPDNLAELYTLQSRRILLERNEDGITGCSLLGGEFFERENAFIEPMTVWRDSGNKKKDIYTPRRHDPSKQFWREFASVYPESDTTHRRPGVISWFALLMDYELIPDGYRLDTRICSVQYGDKDFFVTDVFSDSLSMSGELISEMALPWQACVTESIMITDRVADVLGKLAREIFLAGGGDTESASASVRKAKAEYYFDADEEFRKWLAGIDPGADRVVEKKRDWQEKTMKLAANLGRKMVNEAGAGAIIGRVVNINDNEIMFSAAKAENNFYYRLAQIKGREVR